MRRPKPSGKRGVEDFDGRIRRGVGTLMLEIMDPAPFDIQTSPVAFRIIFMKHDAST